MILRRLEQLIDGETITLDPTYKQDVGGSSPSLPTIILSDSLMNAADRMNKGDLRCLRFRMKRIQRTLYGFWNTFSYNETVVVQSNKS